MVNEKLKLSVEVQRSPECEPSANGLLKIIQDWLMSKMIQDCSLIRSLIDQHQHLFDEVDIDKSYCIISLVVFLDSEVLEQYSDQELTRMWQEADFKYYFYVCNQASEFEEGCIEITDGTPSSSVTTLPCKELHQLWESLLFSSFVKQRLVNYISTAMEFAQRNVNSKIIACNKVVLLHGPPGTGKTSLCKALAQRLAIRLQDRFQFCQLIEINSHSLFSKWFSESGKMVLKLFQQIRELCENPDCLVIILIDEIESLAYTRQSSSNKSDPSDAIRVVNALLTQIDQIKSLPNVIILTTSNVTSAIDLAFLDRADIKEFIDLPSSRAIYEIYRSCIEELMRSGVLKSDRKLSQWSSAAHCSESPNPSKTLVKIAEASSGFSGRTLRKLPFLAVALFSNHSFPLDINDFLKSLASMVHKQREDLLNLR